MKKFKKYIKEENGTISSIVLMTLIFFIIILSTMYYVNANNRAIQLKSQVIVKKTYENEFEDYISLHIYKATLGEKSIETGTINGKKPSSTNPVIPKGFIPINTNTSNWGNGDEEPTLDNLNKGLVITDSINNGNEFVWVPVDKPSDLYENINDKIVVEGKEIPITKCTRSNILKGVIRNYPSSSKNYKEPGIAISTDNSSGFTSDENIDNIKFLGFKDLEDMTTNLINEYYAMIESIENYKGFYIGRYELSETGSKKGANWTRQTWYQAYNMADKIVDANMKNRVYARMIWGLQWDITCKWLGKTGTDLDQSYLYGNYSDVPINSGENETYITNNIYDMAGNHWEWSQEVGNPYGRTTRGADCGRTTDNVTYGRNGDHCITYRNGWRQPTDDSSRGASRAVLVIK